MKGYLGKFALVMVLSLLCLIPLAMVEGVVHERSRLHRQVDNEIAAQHGGYQHLTAPLLLAEVVVQDTRKKRIEDNATDSVKVEVFTTDRTYALTFVPKTTRIKGVMRPKMLHRGIYKIPAFSAELMVNGTFSDLRLPRVGEAYKGGKVVSVSPLRLFMPLKNPRGVTHAPEITWDGVPMDVEPGTGGRVVAGGAEGFSIQAAEGSGDGKKDISFSIKLDILGSHTLSFLPNGGEFSVDMQSAWPHPEFQGAYLPLTREVTKDGFKARWSVTEFSHAAIDNKDNSVSWNQPSFSVELIQPVNIYLKSIRAVKYGILFILLTFVFFLLFELLRRLRIHLVQYGLVAAALVVFYLLLISLSEHIGFGWAYLAASAACILLLTFYVRCVVKSAKTTLAFSGSVSMLYGALYLILLSEQYALLLGSGLIFTVLAASMYLTRDIDWYELGEGGCISRLLLKKRGQPRSETMDGPPPLDP